MNDTVQQDVAAHDARNRQLLASLAAKGVELQAQRRVDVYFRSKSEADAFALMAALETTNFDEVQASPASREAATWNVVASVHATPQAVAATDYTRSLVQLALTHDSEYDGWGTEV